jgi:hypothetical protein
MTPLSPPPMAIRAGRHAVGEEIQRRPVGGQRLPRVAQHRGRPVVAGAGGRELALAQAADRPRGQRAVGVLPR